MKLVERVRELVQDVNFAVSYVSNRVLEGVLRDYQQRNEEYAKFVSGLRGHTDNHTDKWYKKDNTNEHTDKHTDFGSKGRDSYKDSF